MKKDDAKTEAPAAKTESLPKAVSRPFVRGCEVVDGGEATTFPTRAAAIKACRQAVIKSTGWKAAKHPEKAVA